MSLCIVDNYDSFTYNLLHYLQDFEETHVLQHDELDVAKLSMYKAIILSPGPGLPKEKKNLMEIIETYAGKKSILGVCLGMQAIAEYAGASLYNMKDVQHGRAVQIKEVSTHSKLFEGLSCPLQVGLYHSWAVDANTLHSNFKPVAFSSTNHLMAIESEDMMLSAVQFHPESVLSPQGRSLLENWYKSL